MKLLGLCLAMVVVVMLVGRAKVTCHSCQTVFIRSNMNVKVMSKTYTVTHIKTDDSAQPQEKPGKGKAKGWEK